jgi:hypothetical protein
MDKRSIRPRNKAKRFVIEDAVDIMYRIGLSPYKKGSQCESLRHKIYRYSNGIALLIMALKSLIFLVLYLTLDEEEIKSHERIFIVLCDVAYFIPEVRIHWNMTVIIVCIPSFVPYILHMVNKNKTGNWLDLLDCLTGDMEPAKIGIFNRIDMIKLMKRLVIQRVGNKNKFLMTCFY